MRDAFIGPSVSNGSLVEIRRQFAIFLKSNQNTRTTARSARRLHRPVRLARALSAALEVSRVDNRTAIRFMFTWMILRPEQAELFVGIPFDRG